VGRVSAWPWTFALLSLSLLSCAVPEVALEPETPGPIIDGVHPCCPDGNWRPLESVDERAPAPAWCTLPAPPPFGAAEPPSEFRDRLADGIRIEADSVTCPVDFSEWVPFVNRTTIGVDFDNYTFDEDGVLLLDLSGIDPGAGMRHLALAIGNLALMLYGDIVVDRNPGALDMLLDQADWLVENVVSGTYDGTPYHTWKEDFGRPAFDQEAPVTNAYGQGVVLPALLGAFCATGDDRYREAVEQGLAGFAVPMRDGGLTTWIADDAAWYEEAAHTEEPSSRILNGHIGALAGLWTVVQWTGNADAQAFLEAGTRAVREEMNLYNPGFTSVYSQWASDAVFPLVAHASGYNRFHTGELSWLFEVTGDAAFLEEALSIARYDDPSFEATVSGTVSGNPEMPYHRRMIENWVEVSGGWVEWDLDREQTLGGVTLWSNDPALRPESYRVELLRNGEEVAALQREWPTGCNDTYLPLPDVLAGQVRVTLQAPEQPNIGLRGAGLHRTTGDPSAVARWMYHSMANRPGGMFQERGWIYPRGAWVALDLQDSFQALEIELAGWTGIELPVLSGGDGLAERTPVDSRAVVEGDSLFVYVDEVDVRFLRVDFPTTNYSDERTMWVRGSPPNGELNQAP